VFSFLESEWRQGTILPHNLLPDSTLAVPLTTDAKLLLISHDCDLVNSSYDAEPFVELLVARAKPIAGRDGRMFNGKNPRKLQFTAKENGETQLYEINVHEKYRVKREILETGTRDKTVEIAAKDVLLIAKWAGRRYYRPSLPSALMGRAAPVKDKLSKKLKNSGEDISRVYAGLNTLEELPDAEPYRLILRIVVSSETCEDESREQRALSVVSEMRKLLSQCQGIVVEDADLVTESEMTLADVQQMNPWDFDYLSPEEEPSGER
jgi:hypothetical protein